MPYVPGETGLTLTANLVGGPTATTSSQPRCTESPTGGEWKHENNNVSFPHTLILPYNLVCRIYFPWDAGMAASGTAKGPKGFFLGFLPIGMPSVYGADQLFHCAKNATPLATNSASRNAFHKSLPDKTKRCGEVR